VSILSHLSPPLEKSLEILKEGRFQWHNFRKRQLGFHAELGFWKVSSVCKQKQDIHVLHIQDLFKISQPLINLIKAPVVCNKFT